MKFHMGKFSLIGYPKYYCHVGAFWWGSGVCVFPFLLNVMMMMMMIIIALEDKGNCKWDFLLVVVPSVCVHMLMRVCSDNFEK